MRFVGNAKRFCYTGVVRVRILIRLEPVDRSTGIAKLRFCHCFLNGMLKAPIGIEATGDDESKCRYNKRNTGG